MHDPQAILARLRALIEARKASVRIRIVDRAFARIAATGLCLVLLAGGAQARTVSRTVRYNGRLIVINNPTIVQTAPRIETPDPWETMRADYFKRTYGSRAYCR